MTPKLTDDLRQAIEAGGGAPLYLVDSTNNQYVLLHADQFDKLKALVVEDDFDPRASYPLMDKAMSEGWDDPEMDVYDDYDAHRSQPS